MMQLSVPPKQCDDPFVFVFLVNNTKQELFYNEINTYMILFKHIYIHMMSHSTGPHYKRN